VAKTVFGVATEDDVAALHFHIAKFEQLKTQVESDTTHVLETVHSLYQSQDKRMNLLDKMMQGFNYNLSLIESDVYYKLYSFLSMGVL
jgi:hypothetical protein